MSTFGSHEKGLYLIFSFTNFQKRKDISKFTKISICHLVLMLSTVMETGCTYLPTTCSTSTLSQLKHGSTNSVHVNINQTEALSKATPTPHKHLGSVSRIKTDSDCQADSQDTENTRAWRRSRDFHSATAILL